MDLVIVESPHKAKTITSFLGKDYKVMASVGHIKTLVTDSKKYPLGIKIEEGFEPIYEEDKTKARVIAQLKVAASKADKVYLATDPDREGEAIAYHLGDVLGLDVNDTNRLEFHEITRHAILDALKEPRKLDLDLVNSQETRRLLDRIIGFDLTNLLKKKIGSDSAGRVQSVVLKLIVDREKEIDEFKSVTYYTIKALLNINNKEVEAKLVDDKGEVIKLDSLEKANDIVNFINNNPLTINKVLSSEHTLKSSPVYTTSTMLAEASTILKLSSKDTTKIAQTLYEGLEINKDKKPVGLITYMRTDSVRVSPIFINACKKYIEDEYGKEYVGVAKVVNKDNKNVQDAHEGIRPTDINITPEKLYEAGFKKEAKLYELIYRKAKASMMADEKYIKDEVFFKCGEYTLKTTGEYTTFEGFKKEFNKIKPSSRTPLPTNIDNNSVIEKYNAKFDEGHTIPPYRYTEASMIATMKDKGIGRPSTYATIIDINKKREYVKVVKGYFTPTEQGKLTVKKLEDYFSSIINVKYSSEMENILDEIAEKKYEKVEVLSSFYKDFIVLIDDAKDTMKEERIDIGTCPKCGNPLVSRNGPKGKFVGCSNYPACRFIQVKEHGTCPTCKTGTLIEKKGPKGVFIACNNYPTCKYTRSLNFKWHK